MLNCFYSHSEIVKNILLFKEHTYCSANIVNSYTPSKREGILI